MASINASKDKRTTFLPDGFIMPVGDSGINAPNPFSSDYVQQLVDAGRNKEALAAGESPFYQNLWNQWNKPATANLDQLGLGGDFSSDSNVTMAAHRKEDAGNANPSSNTFSNPNEVHPGMGSTTPVGGFANIGTTVAPETNSLFNNVSKLGTPGFNPNTLSVPERLTMNPDVLKGFTTPFNQDIADAAKQKLEETKAQAKVDAEAWRVPAAEALAAQKARHDAEMADLRNRTLGLKEKVLLDKENNNTKEEDKLYKKTVSAQKEDVTNGVTGIDWEHPDVQKALSEGHTPTAIRDWYKSKLRTAAFGG